MSEKQTYYSRNRERISEKNKNNPAKRMYDRNYYKEKALNHTCDICNIIVTKQYFQKHILTNKHIKKVNEKAKTFQPSL